MPKDYEYAVMSGQAYEAEGGTPPQGWEIVYYDSADNGFAAAAYRQVSNDEGEESEDRKGEEEDSQNEIVIAFRGTTNYQNLKTDLSLAMGYIPNIQPSALAFVKYVKKQYPNCKLSFTGHSLGSTLAVMNAILFQVPAVGFEDPGVPNSFLSQTLRKQIVNAEKHIKIYLTAPDLVNTLYPHLGTVYRLFLNHEKALNLRHSISCAWGTLSRALIYYVTVKGLMNYFNEIKTSNTQILDAISSYEDQIAAMYDYNNSEAPAMIGLLAGLLAALPLIDKLKIKFEIVDRSMALSIGGLLLGGILGALPGLYDDFAWLFKRHHLMDEIIAAFDEKSGKPKQAKLVQSWPGFWQHHIANWAIYQAKGLLPFYSGNRGLHTLFNEPQVIERQIDTMAGYKLKNN